MRIATIDIGTVTSRLLIADVEGARVVPVVRHAVITNIGEGTDATGYLKPEAIARTVDCVRAYVDEIHSFDDSEAPVHRIVAMATSASRDAYNAHDFVSELEKLGVTLSVIPGEREAELSFMGAANDFCNEDVLVVDVGGGSTEVVLGRAYADGSAAVPSVQMYACESFNVGCRRMTERFMLNDCATQEHYDKARMWAYDTLAPFFKGKKIPDRIIAVAGTATTAVSIREAMDVYDPDRVHKSVVSHAELKDLFESLSGMTLEQKCQIKGLQPARASVIVAGFLILDVVLELACAESFTVSENDILQGIALSVAV